MPNSKHSVKFNRPSHIIESFLFYENNIYSMSKEREAFAEIAEAGIYYTINRLKRKLKDNFIAFLVYGSYITGDYKVGSDVDCLAIVKSNIINKTNVNHWVFQLKTPLYDYLKRKHGFKILKDKLPEINVNTITEKDFKKKLLESNPMILDTILFGKLYYPKKANPEEFFTISKISKRKYINTTFNDEVPHLLRIYAKQFVKKCFLVARRIYFVDEKKHATKQSIVSLFDKKYPIIAKQISLKKISSYLSNNFEKLELKELINIINNCNKFFSLANNYVKR